MRILVIGSGGREHALAWKLAQTAEVFSAPGNPGMEALGETFRVPVSDMGGLVALAKQLNPDLVVVGPENPLIEGLADQMVAAGFPTFGPKAEFARLEGSKAWSKAMMLQANVPTARSGTFTDPNEATRFAQLLFEDGAGAVIKASGAAMGKGVVVCFSFEEAADAIQGMMVDREFGDAGETVVVEERLDGREFSLLTICSDQGFTSFPVIQDYKRALDGDRGPNTGGMGTICPVNWVTPELVAQTEKEIVAPMLAQLPGYRGVLFSGVMAMQGRPYCLEYNVRFGDPETQTAMRLLESDLAETLLAAAKGEALAPLKMSAKAAVTVVLASGGYPGAYENGKPITIPTDLDPDVVVFHAGTKRENDQIVTAGGRVLGVSATGETLEKAREKAYQAAKSINFDGKFMRTDIGLPS